MPGVYTDLILDPGPYAERLRSPGLAQRLLGVTLGIHAEEVGFIQRRADGSLEVEIAVARADRIETPCTLNLTTGGQEALWTLRRDVDPPDTEMTPLRITWESGAAPTPGALAAALSAAIEDIHGGEMVGAAYVGPKELQIELPTSAITALPATLDVAGQRLQITAMNDRRL